MNVIQFGLFSKKNSSYDIVSSIHRMLRKTDNTYRDCSVHLCDRRLLKNIYSSKPCLSAPCLKPGSTCC